MKPAKALGYDSGNQPREAVDEAYTVGNPDKSSVYWTDFSKHYKIEDGVTTTLNFECYGGTECWNNFIMIFSKEQECSVENRSDTYKNGEYAVVRGDKFGWSYPYGETNMEMNTSMWGEEIQYYQADEMDPDKLNEVMESADVTLKVR